MDNKTLWIVKLDGRKQKYKREKLIKSLEQTFIATGIELSEYTNDKINKIADYVEDQTKDLSKVAAEEVSSLVEKGLMNLKGDYKTVAKQYILYRDERTRMRGNTTDKTVNEIVNGTSDYWTSENSNKNAMLASTQRDYLAGCISEDISRRQLLPTDVVKAHDEGLIHVHDIDYLVQKIHNCFASGTEFVTRTGVRSFASCKDGELVEVLDKDGHWRQAVVHYYGKQRLYEITLKTCTSKKVITCTQNHRWILKDGTVTTNLQEGDSLYALHVAESFGFEPMLMSPREKEMFTLGFVLGDGNDYKFGLHVRLCGAKVQYAKIFEDCGYSLVSIKGTGDLDAYKSCKLSKQAFLATAGWRYLSGTDKEFLFKGFYAADGSATRNQVATANEDILRMICEISAIAGYHISSIATVTHDTNFKKDAILHTVYFRCEQKPNMLWKVVSIKPHRRGGLLQNVWCVEEPITHSFTLAGGVVTGNCCLVNLEDMLQNGTVINGTLIEKPHSFSTACNIATQIMACIASGQYGGQTMSLAHLAPFIDISRKKIRKEVEEELEETNPSEELINKIVDRRLKEEVKRGVQTMQYQINTLNTSNGQTPFCSLFMYLNEAKSKQEKDDLAMFIAEVLNQRIQGTKNKVGVYVTPSFPKLLYVLEEDNITEDSEYWWLTELAAKCTAKRMVPDYISEKVMIELKGYCFPCMGCRSFLTPDEWSDKLGNISNSKTFDGHKGRISYGRFNSGVVTLNLVDLGLSADHDLDKFWKLFEERTELCHKALKCRHERLRGTKSDISPIHWQYGGLARLEPGETIDKLLFNNYSTLSLGYAGLWECVLALTGKKLTTPEGKELGLQIMQKLNDKCEQWKQAENIGYSIYGSPIESTTTKFGKCLKKRFGEIEGITDKSYITNSYHVHVTEHMDAFEKLAFEAEFQKLSPGGAISYIECPNLEKNIDAVLEVIKFIYDTIMYAELNIKSDYCMNCGFDGEILYKEDENGKKDWECPNCGCRDHKKMNIARRTCGYIGSQYWNTGRSDEIHDRVTHLDNFEAKENN